MNEIYVLIEAGASMVGFSIAIFGMANIFGEDSPIARLIACMSIAIASLFGLSIITGILSFSNQFGMFNLPEQIITWLQKLCYLWFLFGVIVSVVAGIYILYKFIVGGGV